MNEKPRGSSLPIWIAALAIAFSAVLYCGYIKRQSLPSRGGFAGSLKGMGDAVKGAIRGAEAGKQ